MPDLVGPVPVVETPRLRLRAHREDDLPDCAAMWADPIVTRFIGGVPSTRQQTWTRLLSYAGHWALKGFGYWAIEEKHSGAFVGEAGLADFKREIVPAMRDVPEIGFALATRFHEQGYATEAVRAALQWADANLPYEKTVCLINSENQASLRIAEKLGYQIFEHGSYNGKPVVFLSRAVPGNSARHSS